ncbi:MAG: flippase-like domain-containing protein [Syntrophales bacterium]|jgi:uncharacterized membrane protein YbhN (UPF0104 family)|nr:flippase-like domain-containing protein [Syntrophales bacterium]MCK9528808.1 flippase-like domain-containing protein [Syntrophales bacterium]
MQVCKSGALAFIFYFSPKIVIPWLITTFLARLLMVEVFVRPIQLLGVTMRRMSAFWLGWLRTFFNQMIPLSGITLIAAYCKRHCGLAWGELGALSSPLYFLSLAATGIFATGSIILGADKLGNSFVPVAVLSVLITSLSIAIIAKGSVVLVFLPAGVRRRLDTMERSLRLFEGHGQLLSRLFVSYGGILLLRCIRLWLLFFLGTNLNLGVQEILLLAAISEFGFLVPLIPGGIGVREGALISVAWMLGLDMEIVAAVALMDRLFSIVLVAIMAIPAYFVLRKEIVAVAE